MDTAELNGSTATSTAVVAAAASAASASAPLSSSSSSFPLDQKVGGSEVSTVYSATDFDFTTLEAVDDPLAFLLATPGPTLTYPSTHVVLEGLWPAFPYFSIEAVDQLLRSWGAPYVNGLLIFPENTLVEIGVPPSIVRPLLDRAQFLAVEAEDKYEAQKGVKGKGKM